MKIVFKTKQLKWKTHQANAAKTNQTLRQFIMIAT